MSAAPLFWLAVLATGIGVTLTTWTCLNTLVCRVIPNRALPKLWVRNVAALDIAASIDRLHYLAVLVGIACALKALWDGNLLSAVALVLGGLLLAEPLHTWINARKIFNVTPVIELTFICLEQGSREMSILQRLDMASSMLGNVRIRGIIEEMLQDFREGATEEQVIQVMLAQNRNRVWSILIWILLAQAQGYSNYELRGTVKEMMQQKLVLYHRARIAMQGTRCNLGLALALCGALMTSLAFASGSDFVATRHVLALAVLVLFAFVWAALVWSTQLQTLQRMME